MSQKPRSAPTQYPISLQVRTPPERPNARAARRLESARDAWNELKELPCIHISRHTHVEE
jgi:hypothetical protein